MLVPGRKQPSNRPSQPLPADRIERRGVLSLLFPLALTRGGRQGWFCEGLNTVANPAGWIKIESVFYKDNFARLRNQGLSPGWIFAARIFLSQ